MVLTKDTKGNECHKPIEDIKEGDLVWAYDEETGESDWKEVVQLFRNESSVLCHVSIEGEDEPIISTPGHKYFVPFNTGCRDANERLEHAGYAKLSDKWVSAKDLKVGDKILLSDGKYGTIKSVKIEQLDKPVAVYNFEVEDFHTYYVGKNGVCTHNANCGFDNYVNDPKSLWGQSADDVAQNLGEGWMKGSYGSKGTGWKFTNGDKMVAYHPGGGRHVGSYYKLSSGTIGKIKVVGLDYVHLPGDKAIIINIFGGMG